MNEQYKECMICPRKCGINRDISVGVCRSGAKARISRVSRHMFEEHAICGKNGAGTVFFSGCNLGCVFCQNSLISQRSVGKDFDENELAELFLTVAESGVSTLDLVTPTHFTPTVAAALAKVKDKLGIPVVWNSGGYESTESLALLRGLVDIYLPDYKYYSSELSAKYSHAADYRARAEEAILYMYDMLGAPVVDGNGMMLRGIIVRHLVLPGQRKDSIACLHRLAEILPARDIRLSLMRQYTPDFYQGEDKNLHRRVTSFEYESVLREAVNLGFGGYMQSASSASAKYTPEFSDTFCIDLS